MISPNVHILYKHFIQLFTNVNVHLQNILLIAVSTQCGLSHRVWVDTWGAKSKKELEFDSGSGQFQTEQSEENTIYFTQPDSHCLGVPQTLAQT
jgi:hypothetical protein